ncbi:MAG: allantoinase AllB [Planctomycetota bacterium]
MPIDLLIRGGQLVTPTGVREADLAIDGGRIVGFDSADARDEIDATGLHVFPGLIDPHVHFNEPGRTEWEGFATGSAALTAGGGTVFFDMPLNSTPVLDVDAFDAKAALAAEKSVADFGLWGGLTPNNLDNMPALIERGVVGFKAFMCDTGIDDFAYADLDTLRKGMEIAAEHDALVAVHAERQETAVALRERADAAPQRDWETYLKSRPPLLEVVAVQEALALAKDTGCRLHIVHVSVPYAIELVQQARADGVDVTCETCPHYLAFTEDDLVERGASLKCAPPLRNADAAAQLWEDLGGDRFAFVASDHSPCPPAMKDADDPFKVWGGIAGVQSTRSVLLSGEPALKLDAIANLTAANVADRFRIENKGQIADGFDADLALVDLSEPYELTAGMLLDRHRANPYVDRTFAGLTRRTILRGVTMYLDGNIIADPCGKLLTPWRLS